MFALILLIAFFSEPCFALRCNKSGQLINPGDTKYEVLERCGEPKSREVIGDSGSTRTTHRGYHRSGSGYLILEVWILDWKQNADQVDYRLLFKGDELIELEHLD
jgi:hypothetical protein